MYTFSEASQCDKLIEGLDDVVNAEKLYCITKNDFYSSSHARRIIASNIDNIKNMLNIINNKNINMQSRIYVLKTILTFGDMCLQANKEGGINICIDIIKDNDSSEDLVDAAIGLLNSNKYESNRLQLMEAIKGFINTIENGEESQKLSAAKVLVRLTGWKWSVRDIMYKTRANGSPVFDITSEIGAIESIIQVLKSNISLELTNQLCILVAAIVYKNNVQGFGIFLDLGIVDILLSKLIQFEYSKSCLPILSALEAVSRTEDGQDDILSTLLNLEGIFKQLLGLEKCDIEDLLNGIEESRFTAFILTILSRLSFHSRINPLLNELLILNDDNSMYWLGLYMRCGQSGAIFALDGVYDIVVTNASKAGSFTTIGQLSLLHGFLSYCEKKQIDKLIEMDIHNILLSALKAEVSTPLVTERLWFCVRSICNGSQLSLSTIYSSEIVSYLPSSIEKGSKDVLILCCDIISKILKIEEGVLRLPVMPLVTSLTTRLNIPDSNFDNSYTYETSSFPEAVKAAETLTLLVKSQPPQIAEKVRDDIFDVTFEIVWSLIKRITFSSLYYFTSTGSFMDLLKSFSKCKQLKAMQTAALTSITSESADENLSLEHIFFLSKFTEEIDDSTVTERFSQFTMDSSFCSSSKVTLERRVQVIVVMGFSCISKTFRSKLAQRPIFDSLVQVLESGLGRESYEVNYAAYRIYSIVSSSTSSITDLIVSKSITPLLMSFYLNSTTRYLVEPAVCSLLELIVEKTTKVNETKFAEIAAAFFDSRLLEVIEQLTRGDKEAKLHPTSVLKVIGYLLSSPIGAEKLENLLQELSFTQLLKVISCDEGLTFVISSYKIFKRVVDTVKSHWEELTVCEKHSVASLLCWFACFRSSFKSDTSVVIPEILATVKRYTSLLSTCQSATLDKGVECLKLWFDNLIDSASLLSSDVARLLSQVSICSYKVNKTSRFSEIKAIVNSCLKLQSDAHQGFVKELVSALISHVSTASSTKLARSALKLAQTLYPNEDGSILLRSMSTFVELGGLQVLLERISVPKLYRTRSLFSSSASVLGNLIINSTAAAKKFHEMGGSSTTVRLLKDERSDPTWFLWILLNYVTAEVKVSWTGFTMLLNEGLLEVITPIAREGPKANGYWSVLQILQLASVRGSDKHREVVSRSEACQLVVRHLTEGSCPRDWTGRASYLLAYCLSHDPRVKVHLTSQLDLFDTTNTSLTMDTIEKLSKICDSKSKDFFEFLRSAGIGKHLLPLYEYDKYQQDERDKISGLVTKLVKFIPEEFVCFGRALSKELQTRLLKFETPSKEAVICSYISKISRSAKAVVAASPHHVFGDMDSGNEQFACIMLSIVQSFCASFNGMDVLFDSGVTETLCQALASAKTAAMKLAVLRVLSSLSSVESNRAKLNKVIEPVFSFLTSHVHMEIVDDSQLVSPVDNESDVSFAFDLFLSHDWGTDELGRNSHDRVSKINSLLQAKGCKTWFDEEQMRGSIASKMAKGISESKCFVVFLTGNYIKKASGLGPKGEDDNCFFEFDTAVLERGRSNMISVVLEPSCRDTSKWAAGVVKGKLGTKLYIDLSANEDDDSFLDGITKLLREVSVVAGKSFDAKEKTVATSNSKSRYRDVAYSKNDVEIGRAAQQVLYRLSLSESNRSTLESIELLFPYTEYFCESQVLGFPNLVIMAVLANVFAPQIDLTSHTEGISKRNTRVLEVLNKFDYYNVLYEAMSSCAQEVGINDAKQDIFETYLTCVSNLSHLEDFRCHKIASAFIEVVLRALIQGDESLVRLKAVHKIVACEIFSRCCQSDDCRKVMIQLGVDKLVKSISALLKANDENEDNARLWFSSKQALNALLGQLDCDRASNSFRASTLVQEGTLTLSDLSSVPTFQTFVSYKRSSAQDFARLLHSMITGNNWSCFIDAENLDKIDMLSLLVAGSDVFICILSDDVFSSKFWKHELNYAVKAGIPVVLVVKDGSRFPDSYGQMTESFPSYDTIDKEFTGDYERCREVFKTKAIHHSNEYFRSFSVNLLRKIEICLEEVHQKYKNTIAKREVILSRRQAITSTDNNEVVSDTSSSMMTGVIVPSRPLSAREKVVGRPQNQSMVSLYASQLPPQSYGQPQTQLTSSSNQQVYHSQPQMSSYMNQIQPHVSSLNSPTRYYSPQLASPQHYNNMYMSSPMSSQSIGLLGGVESIKQIFGLDPNTPILEAVATVENMLGITGHGALPLRVQMIKTTLGL